MTVIRKPRTYPALQEASQNTNNTQNTVNTRTNEFENNSNNNNPSYTAYAEENSIDNENRDQQVYNSEDEYEGEAFNEEDDSVREREFRKRIQTERGFQIKEMKGDGSCLFRAVADQVYGDQEMHDVVRRNVCDYMQKNSDFFAPFVSGEDFSAYLDRKRSQRTPGNHLEMQALAELFNRVVEVYEYDSTPINTFQSTSSIGKANTPIRVSYHRKNHYNGLRHPYEASVGVGLGLPGLKPGAAEESLISEAVKLSKDDCLSRRMLEDKLEATDLEATSRAIQEEIERQSYLEWVQRMEKQDDSPTTSTAAAAAAQASTSRRARNSTSPPTKSPSPKNLDGEFKRRKTLDNNTTTTTTPASDSCSKKEETKAPEASGAAALSSWGDYVTEDDEEEILQKILQMSESDYFESLKK